MATTYPGSRVLIEQALQLGQIPEQALEICMASVTLSTLKQYNSGLKLWWLFCKSQNINIFLASIPDILNFLTHCYNKGASYGSLNSYRSSIAQLLGPSIATDTRIKIFFKGVYHLRPNNPKYENTWDPSRLPS